MGNKIKGVCMVIVFAALCCATGYLAGYEHGRFDYGNKDYARMNKIMEEDRKNFEKHLKRVDALRDDYTKLIDSIYNLKK